MPRSEVWKGDGERIDEYKVICTDDNYLESGQRYGLMEDERSISGQKRICHCYGYTRGWCEHRFLPYFLIVMYPMVYLMGYYSGLISNCICSNGSSPM
tara:strand:+ start:270 stop:563 length:294 start_codon:yes stop_codon:yes gene_type:complete